MAMKVGELDRITIIRPDDWHLHLRDGDALPYVLRFTANIFGRAIIMPNLKLPVTTVELAATYRKRILRALLPGSKFNPLMTLYLTDNTLPEEIDRAKQSGFIHGVKLYPAGATTHSDAGVTDIRNVYPALERMEKVGMPLLVHGEVTDPDVDVFDREVKFLYRVLDPVVRNFPKLRIVLEHVTTKEGVEFVIAVPGIAATITAHHLLLNRNALFQGGIRPHHYCLPVLKREEHRQALLQAATSGNPKFFLGTDSAPHSKDSKEAACGCAGCYTAPAGIELYAEAFNSVGKLDMLEGFASRFGPSFYGLPVNTDTVTLVRGDWKMPEEFDFGSNTIVVPFRAGEIIRWRF